MNGDAATRAIAGGARAVEARGLKQVFETAGTPVHAPKDLNPTRRQAATGDGTTKTRDGQSAFVARKPFQTVDQGLSAWKELTAPRRFERSGNPASRA